MWSFGMKMLLEKTFFKLTSYVDELQSQVKNISFEVVREVFVAILLKLC